MRDSLEIKKIICPVGDGEARKRYVWLKSSPGGAGHRKTGKRFGPLESGAGAGLPFEGQAAQQGLLPPVNAPHFWPLPKDLKNGVIKIDPVKVKAEERLDGKCLLRISDDSISAEDVALGYKQLIEVESAFRTLKNTLELRPVYHRIEQWIRTHVLLCWLTLLMVRLAEKEIGESWPKIREYLERIHIGEFKGPKGFVCQRTELTNKQISYFKALKLEQPSRFFKITIGHS